MYACMYVHMYAHNYVITVYVSKWIWIGKYMRTYIPKQL